MQLWYEKKQEAWRRPRISDHWQTDYLYIYLSIYLSIYLYMQYAHIYLSIYLADVISVHIALAALRLYLATLSIFMQILKKLPPSSSICTILWVLILRKFPPSANYRLLIFKTWYHVWIYQNKYWKLIKKQIVDIFFKFSIITTVLFPSNAICRYLERAALTRVIYEINWHVLFQHQCVFWRYLAN